MRTDLNQGLNELTFVYIPLYSWLLITWTLANSNLLLSRSNFYLPSGYSLYNFTFDKNFDNELPITRTFCYFPWRFKLLGVDCNFKKIDLQSSYKLSFLFLFPRCISFWSTHFSNLVLKIGWGKPISRMKRRGEGVRVEYFCASRQVGLYLGGGALSYAIFKQCKKLMYCFFFFFFI